MDVVLSDVTRKLQCGTACRVAMQLVCDTPLQVVSTLNDLMQCMDPWTAQQQFSHSSHRVHIDLILNQTNNFGL